MRERKKTLPLHTRFIPSNWDQKWDRPSDIEISAELLFGMHWSHIFLFQTDLGEKPQWDWAAETWWGLALAGPHQAACTTPDWNPKMTFKMSDHVLLKKRTNSKILNQDSLVWHWWKQLRKRHICQLSRWCLAPAFSLLKVYDQNCH